MRAAGKSLDYGRGAGVGRDRGVGVGLGVGVGVTSSLSVKASCWDVLLIATRPSVHEVRCLVAIPVP